MEDFTPTGCAICAHAYTRPDPDPDDWFCDDDVKVICGAVPLEANGEPVSRNVITCACRPYNVTKECSYTPTWCPLNGQIVPRTI